MQFKKQKLLSIVLALMLIVSMMPISAFAATISETLYLGPPKSFDLQLGDSAAYSYTAAESGTYIVYIRDITEGVTPSYHFNGKAADAYSLDEENWMGHVVELAQGEVLTVTFDANHAAYSGMVGIDKPAALKMIYLTNGVHSEAPHFRVSNQKEWLGLLFSTDNFLNWGVQWSATSSNPNVLEVDRDSSSAYANRFNPVFLVKGIGETTITITAEYNGVSKTLEYTAQVYNDPVKRIDTFAELKEIIQNHDGSFVEVDANEDAQIIITEDLTIPDNMGFCADNIGCYVKVASGATLTTGDESFSCRNLDVEGTMNVNGYVYVADTLNISGTVNAENDDVDVGSKLVVTGTLNLNEYNLGIDHPATIQGIDNIHFGEDYTRIFVHATFGDAAGLAAVTEDVRKNYIQHDRVFYIIHYRGRNAASASLTIDSDITVPAHAELQLDQIDTYTLAAGKTLTLEGSLNICTNFVVDGKLINTDSLYVQNEDSWSHGVLNLTNGSYEGKGRIRINASRSNIQNLSDVLVGVNMNDFDVEYHVDPQGYLHWDLTNVAGLIKLGTPTNLKWGIEYQEEWKYDPITDTHSIVDYHPVLRAGYMSWETALPDQSHAIVDIYKEGEAEPVYHGNWRFGGDVHPEYRSMDVFMSEDMESGKYYFTVTSRGDYKTYRNSDTAVSDKFTYIRPSGQIETPANLAWNGVSVSWDAPADRTYVDGYWVQFYYSKTKDGNYESFNGMSSRNGPNALTMRDDLDHVIEEKGAGYYKFKVMAFSSDITKVRNSKWSDFSPVFDLTKLPETVTQDLADLIHNLTTIPGASADDIRQEVQKMDTEDLKTTMLTDRGNTGATQKLQQLENMAGGPANISVSQDAAAFDANQISVVGANLNTNTSTTGGDITLVVDKPQTNHIIPELYDSAVSVSFSMTLNNVADPKNLEVPVKITLPVPNTINPDFLVILHYHADGTHETIYPHIYRNNHQWYADFVLTSFSDFVMTQAEHVHNWSSEWSSDGLYHWHECMSGGCDALWHEKDGFGKHISATGDSCEQCGYTGQIIPTVPMFRMYDPNGGEHFYTGSEDEKNILIAAGWNYEGVGFNFPAAGAPVYRLYDRYDSGDHLYTMDQEEIDRLLADGWEMEGVAFNSAGENEVAQYRLYNPNAHLNGTRGAWHFTSSVDERDHLVSLGWEYQGIGWYSSWQ